MKTLRNVSLTLFTILLLAACGGGASSPESVVEKYLEAAKVVDLEAAKKCLAKSLAQEFDDITKLMSEEEIEELKAENANLKVANIRSEIDGDNATVYFDEAHGDHSHTRQIPMVKEDGEWKMAAIY